MLLSADFPELKNELETTLAVCHVSIASKMMKLGDSHAPIRFHLLEALTYNPKSSDAYNNLALLEKEVGNIVVARSLFSKAIEYLNVTEGDSAFILYNNLAAISNEDIDAKLYYFRKAIESDPRQPGINLQWSHFSMY